MKRLRFFLRSIKCAIQRKYHRLKHVKSTAYISFNSDISKDIVVGDYVYIGPGSIIGPKVTISDYSMIGPGVLFIGDDHRYDIPGVPSYFSGRPVLRPTFLGKDVWIGGGAIVMSGVEIGDGSIVAAGTVVTKNIPPCEIHAGVPNKKIRDRFDDDDKSKHLAFLKLPAKAGEFCGARY